MNAEVANYVPTYTVSGPPTNGEASWVYEGYSYIGSYKDGLFNGWGEITWTGEYLGHRYVGNFVNGFRHGEGTYTFPNGEIQVGLFVNDEFVSPPEVVKNNECNSIEEIILHYGNKKIAALGRRFFINNGPIFAKKTKNFYESFSKVHFSIDLAEEKPVLFYDGTILGSGKDGIVFSDNFIYAKGCIGRPVEHVDIAYSQIDSVRMSGLEIYIESAGHLELITLRLIHATPEDLFLIVEMLKKIQDFVKH